MTDEYEPEAIKASWERILPAGSMVPARFYQTLFSVHPEIRAAFPLSMSDLYTHLGQTIDLIVRNADDLDKATPHLHALGRRHASRAKPEDYTKVGGALKATLAHFDPEWSSDPNIAESWGQAYDFAAARMQEAAEDLATDPQAPDPSPRWYYVYGLKRTSPYASRVILRAQDEAASVTHPMHVSVLGRPGWWITVDPYSPSDASDESPDIVQLIGDGSLIVFDLVISDHRSRAIALARPGTRVAVAPEVSQ